MNGPVLASPSKQDWAQLLGQASEFNDELCRENCELNRELAVLRQKTKRLQEKQRRKAEGGHKAARAAMLLPKVMSHVRRALHGPSFAAPPPGCEGLAETVEDAVRGVLVKAAEAARGNIALASSDETAALVSEKIALKEFSMRQQERLQELEKTREELHNGTWAKRLSAAFQGTVAEASAGFFATLEPRSQHDADASKDDPVSDVACETALVEIGQQCEIVGRKGAIIRSTAELNSDKVATLPVNCRVLILEIGGEDNRRARIRAVPVEAGVNNLDSAVVSHNSSETPVKAERISDEALASTSDEPPHSPISQVSKDDGGHLETPAPANRPDQQALAAEISEGNIAGAIGWLSITTKDGKALLRPVANVGQSAQDPSLGKDGSEPVVPLTPPSAVKLPLIVPLTAAEILANPVVNANGTVTIGTEAWQLLRKERGQRERQTKAFQSQLESAQRELDQLAEIKKQLREQRALALQARRRGNELHEATKMAEEELLTFQLEKRELCHAAIACSDIQAEPGFADQRSPREKSVSQDGKASAPAEFDVSDSDNIGGKNPTVVEWKRLLSEREATAHDLSCTITRIEELERDLEDRHVEMQIAEKRRDRERNSLLTALRELRANQGSETGDTDEDEDPGSVDFAVQKRSTSGKSDGLQTAESSAAGLASVKSPARSEHEMKYLYRISELEDAVERVRRELDAVQCRVSALNESAVVRGAALRHATCSSKPEVSEFPPSMPAGLSGVRYDALNVSRTGRRDLDGLMEMLDRLYVENFALRARVAASAPLQQSTSSASNALSPATSGAGSMVDLTKFVVSRNSGGGALADDTDSETDQGAPGCPRMPLQPLAPLVEGGRPALSTPPDENHACRRTTFPLDPKPSTQLPPQEIIDSCRPPPRDSADSSSPRSRLLSGLDFKSLSVVE